MTEERKQINKLIIIIAILIVSIILLIGTTLAIFSERAEDIVRANVGKIGVALVEDYPDAPNEFGTETYEKYVRGLPIADKDAFVRFKCVPVVEFYDEEPIEGQNEENWVWKTAPIDESKILITYSGDDFVEQDGYWYYKKILKPQEETSNLKVEWQILEMPMELKEYKLRTNLRVILEYSQVTNNAWKTIFNIDSLPEGVGVE